MFNFRELHVIHDALQNYPIAPERTDIIKKIFNMVSASTLDSFAPCVRPRNPNKPEDTDQRERMVVFDSERELLRLLEEVAFAKEKIIGHQFVAISLPSAGLADVVAEKVWRYIGGQFEPQRHGIDRRRFELKNGLHIEVMNRGSYGMCGMVYEWVFFYNEVSGF